MVNYHNLSLLTANLTGFDLQTAISIIEQAGRPDIVAFQETWTYQSERSNFSIKGYNFFHKSAMKLSEKRKGRPHGGLLLYVKSNIPVQQVELKNSRILPVSMGGLVLANTYMPFNGHQDETLYFACLDDLERLRMQSSAFIVLGDMNPTGDNRVPFNSFCTENNMICDESVEWTYIEPRAFHTSRLDYCLVEKSEHTKIQTSTTIHTSVIKGGHVPLLTGISVANHIFQVPVENYAQDHTQSYRAVPSTLPDKFFTEVDRQCHLALEAYQNNSDVESLLRAVDTAVESTLDQFYPVKQKRKGRAKNIMQFPAKEKQTRDDAYALWALANKPGHDHPLSKLLREKNMLFRKAVKAAKRKQLQEEADHFLRNHKRLKKLRSPNMAEVVGNARTRTEICEMWRKRFASGTQEQDCRYENHGAELSAPCFFVNSGSFRFTPKKLLKAIRRTPKGKAYDTGTTGVSPDMYGSETVATCLSIAFNHLCTHSLPQPEGSIFTFYLRPTLKANSKPKDVEKSYRPISISGLSLVFYERVLCTDMEIKVNQVLPEMSFAYRPARGTTMPILRLKQLLQRKGAIALFLDASDAFGCIRWEKLFRTLKMHGFDVNLIAAIKRLYQLSQGRVIWRGVSSMGFVLNQGVRQGGCISGHLFNLYFAQLQAACSNAFVLFYADDLVIVVFHPWAAVLTILELEQLSRALNVNWNPSKCKVMQMPAAVRHQFRMYGEELENVNRFIYLGWIFVREARNSDDEQAAKQAGRFYSAAHETSQAYKFTRQLPWDQRVNFAKTFGGLYAPECYTNLSQRALSRLQAAHRYLYMRLTGWNGEEAYDEEASVSSISIGSEDSAEEFYDTRSRWLYAYAAAKESTSKFGGVRHSSCSVARACRSDNMLVVEHLKPAPSVGMQMRKANYRIKSVIRKIGLDICIDAIAKSKCVESITKPFIAKARLGI